MTVHATCCFVPCDRRAEWEIISGPGPDDNTLSCPEHVGMMLAPIDGKSDPGEYTVAPPPERLAEHIRQVLTREWEYLHDGGADTSRVTDSLRRLEVALLADAAAYASDDPPCESNDRPAKPTPEQVAHFIESALARRASPYATSEDQILRWILRDLALPDSAYAASPRCPTPQRDLASDEALAVLTNAVGWAWKGSTGDLVWLTEREHDLVEGVARHARDQVVEWLAGNIEAPVTPGAPFNPDLLPPGSLTGWMAFPPENADS